MTGEVAPPGAAEGPYLGLAAFGEVDEHRFFGRDAEAADLLRLVRGQRLVLFFGLSGLGKTSLLQAGLVPRLRVLDMLPVVIRLDYSSVEVPLAYQVMERLREECARHQVDARPPSERQTLWEYLHSVPLWDSRNRLVTPVLIFDQFEEAFTLGSSTEAFERFAQELADLAGDRIPVALEERVARALEEEFLQSPPLRIVLALREDFLGELEKLSEAIPSLAQARLRLTPMNGQQALEAVLRPAEGLVTLDVADQIVRSVGNVRATGTATEAGLAAWKVEPAILSLVCQQLEQRREVAGSDRIPPRLAVASTRAR